MDIFRFLNPTAPTLMEQGVFIYGATSKMWVERFTEAGEFTIEGPLSANLKEQLPIGSYISHTDSDEIMVVESRQIKGDGDGDPLVTVTGRSFETWFDQRIVGSNIAFPTTGAFPDYILPDNPTWTQVLKLINDHSKASSVIDPDNALPYFETVITAGGTPVTTEERTIARDSVYKAIVDILKVDELGIQVIRPGRTTIGSDPQNSVIRIHRGADRSDTVSFDYDAGEVTSADYIWSNLKAKNCALVVGKWVGTFVDTAAAGAARRMAYIDASDIDQNWNEAPTGGARGIIVAAMQARGKQELAAMGDIALASADISQGSRRYQYRKDYNVGDIVSVTGNFNESNVMRVEEFVEIDDESGHQAYPSLSAIEESE